MCKLITQSLSGKRNGQFIEKFSFLKALTISVSTFLQLLPEKVVCDILGETT